MRMNVQPIPGVSDRINEIRPLTAEIVNKEILPNENELWAGARRRCAGGDQAARDELRDGDQGEGEAGGPLGAAPARRSTAAPASTSSSTPT